MKRFTKILCLVLAVSLMLPFFASCGKGNVVAVYDGIPVYEDEVQDLINYTLIRGYNQYTTDEDIENMMRDAVRTYVRYKAMELDLENKGYTVDEKVLKESIAEAKKQLEEEGGGYKAWRESYRVSKNFLEEEMRRYYITELYNEANDGDIKVSESEARAYYQTHALTDFAVHAGYYWDSLLRPIRDITDAEENAAAKAEMDQYLEKIKNGTMTWDAVKKELDSKYNMTTGYPNAMYSGEDFTGTNAMITIESEAKLQEFLAEIDKEHEKRDPNADPKSEEYAAYMNYLGNSFQANVYYALQNLEVGEVWGETFQSFVGYYIIRLNGIELANDFVPYDEVSGKIIELLLAQKLEAAFVEYFENLDEEYDISYIFDAVSY